MKTLLSILVASVLVGNAMAADDVDDQGRPILPVKIDVSKRVPVNIDSYTMLRTYANNNDYYFSVKLKEGMKVYYSASYGVGGEAGQAEGVIVEKNGKFVFKQRNNPTNQLLLPPGLPFNSSDQTSMWDVGAYMELINRVAFSEPNMASKSATQIYAKPNAAIVDFVGGTAGKSVSYKDALEVVFTKSDFNRAKAESKFYYSKGIGPVALEFREDSSVGGTFKFYLGE
jgi:hypothetical protein